MCWSLANRLLATRSTLRSVCCLCNKRALLCSTFACARQASLSNWYLCHRLTDLQLQAPALCLSLPAPSSAGRKSCAPPPSPPRPLSNRLSHPLPVTLALQQQSCRACARAYASAATPRRSAPRRPQQSSARSRSRCLQNGAPPCLLCRPLAHRRLLQHLRPQAARLQTLPWLRSRCLQHQKPQWLQAPAPLQPAFLRRQ